MELECFVPTTVTVRPTGQGSLSGLSVAVKDLFAVAGHTSSFGHPRWRATHGPAPRHAAVVERLLGAGATVAGLAKMDQLAYSLIGNAGEGEAPVNAFDPECFCGGSSSGSASAVAGRIVDVGIGTDTGGSIRVPAAACGLFSLRPSHGRIAVEGMLPLAPSFDTVGLLARHPALLAKTLAVLAPTPRPVRQAHRVLLATDLGAREALVRLARRLADAAGGGLSEVRGATLVNDDTGDLFARLQGREIWQQHGAWVTEHASHLAEDVQARLRRCRSLSEEPEDAKAADGEARRAYTAVVHDLLGGDAVLVLPVVPGRGPLRAWSAEELVDYRVKCFRLTAPSSLSGAPQVVIPVATAGRSQPVPAAIVGWPGSDPALLGLAERLADGAERVAV
jgi:amidase